MGYFANLTPEEAYVWEFANFDDKSFWFDCPCGKTLWGRNKVELLDNFQDHFPACPSNT